MKNCVLLLSFWVLGLAGAFAQKLIDDRVELSVLVFENLDKNELKFVRKGGHVQYELRSQRKRKYSGELEKITDEAMTVNGTEIKFADCKYIRGKVRTDRNVLGGFMAGIGAGTAVLGGVLISTIPGAIILGGGIAALSAGVSFITSKKKFDFDKGWRVYGGKIQFSR